MADDNFDDDLFDDLYADDAPPAPAAKPKSPTPEPAAPSSNAQQPVNVAQPQFSVLPQETAGIPVMGDDTNGHGLDGQGGNDAEDENYGPVGIKEDG